MRSKCKLTTINANQPADGADEALQRRDQTDLMPPETTAVIR
jgi:hypothetical protein